jgi:N-methylhydantoinase B/oxoprolinase/acetone carboxylase alpha subunit
VKLARRGEIVADIMSLLLANVRTPDEREGDITAQIAANRVGESRIRQIVQKYGSKRVALYASALQDYTERVVRAAIERIPDGEYTCSDALDDDGFTDAALRIRATIRISGNGADVDFTGSDPQTTGGVNANFAITLSATLYGFRCLVDEDVLYNAGIGRAVRVTAPAGTIVNAQRPAAVAGGNVETSQRITDVILGALGKALPEKMTAASQGTMNNVTLGGTDPRSGQRFAYYETIGGGMGARNGLDGLSGVHTHMSNTRNTPVEAIEHYLPVRITQYRLRQDSGGAGRFRGGEGIVREYEALTETAVTVLSDRRRSAPYGAHGGAPGGMGRNSIRRASAPDVTEAVPGKAWLTLQPGDRLRIETPGGGGWGEPEEQTP